MGWSCGRAQAEVVDPLALLGSDHSPEGPVENGIGLLLTTEASPKTNGSVSELSKACQMMFSSMLNHVPPKNLGIDLLMYKEKTRRSYPVRLPGR
jgi:hypothetical protein